VDRVKKAAKKLAKLWDPSDTVHMRTEGYRLLAVAAANLAAEMAASRDVTTATTLLAGQQSYMQRRQSWVTGDDAIAVRKDSGRGQPNGHRPHQWKANRAQGYQWGSEHGRGGGRRPTAEAAISTGMGGLISCVYACIRPLLYTGWGISPCSSDSDGGGGRSAARPELTIKRKFALDMGEVYL
jgi:hypothetical protein